MADLAQRRAKFARLHESGCFVMPNPWDAGTTRFLEGLGFPALATTSAGFAFSRGKPDAVRALSRDDVLEHVQAIVAATDLPVNADFQNGYGDAPDDVAANVRRCVETGVAGLSIEDATGDAARPLYPLDEAVERVRAARAAIDSALGSSGQRVLLTARAEAFLVGAPKPLEDALRRLPAYAAAGADVLFAPGVNTREEIRSIVKAVAPRPVNVLMGANLGLSVADLGALGVRRVSVGSALARAAWTGVIRAARGLAAGSFAGFEGVTPFAELNGIFASAKNRSS